MHARASCLYDAHAMLAHILKLTQHDEHQSRKLNMHRYEEFFYTRQNAIL